MQTASYLHTHIMYTCRAFSGSVRLLKIIRQSFRAKETFPIVCFSSARVLPSRLKLVARQWSTDYMTTCIVQPECTLLSFQTVGKQHGMSG